MVGEPRGLATPRGLRFRGCSAGDLALSYPGERPEGSGDEHFRPVRDPDACSHLLPAPRAPLYRGRSRRDPKCLKGRACQAPGFEPLFRVFSFSSVF